MNRKKIDIQEANKNEGKEVEKMNIRLCLCLCMKKLNRAHNALKHTLFPFAKHRANKVW